MRVAGKDPDPTVEWMRADIAMRCREALQRLEPDRGSSYQLGDAAMLLRSAADDLVSLVELIEGPTAAARLRNDDPSAFDLAFRDAGEQTSRD